MLISTLAMKSFTLVLITLLLIHCHAIVVRDDDYQVPPKSFDYSDSGLAASEMGYRSDDHYRKPFRRVDGRTYQSVENNQETNYSEQDAENYPFTQGSHRQQISRRRTPTKKLYVEQYLKEVTPTTKTAYNQRPGNYLRSSDQPRDRVIEQTEESQRGNLKPSVQYIVQSSAQERLPSQQQVEYVVADGTSAQLKQSDQDSSAALAAYQNALLAHQKLLETEGHDETSRSSIYVTHTIPKKPIRKIVKPVVKDEEVEQYINSKRFGLQQQQISVYERQQPAEVRYQAKIEQSNRYPNFQVSTEAPTYQNEEEPKQKFRQDLESFKTRYQQLSTEGQEKPMQPHQIAQYQQLLLNGQGNRPVTFSQQPQVSANIPLQTPEVAEYKTSVTTEERPSIQYQQRTYLKQGPKYLPESKGRYQSLNLNEEEQYQPTLNIPIQNQDALLKYQAAIAKIQSERLVKARQQRLRPQVAYEQQDLDSQIAGYSSQYPAENQEATVSETEYVRIGGTNKYRPTENTSPLFYTQPNQNPNVRYYRNPGRPAVSYSQYQ